MDVALPLCLIIMAIVLKVKEHRYAISPKTAILKKLRNTDALFPRFLLKMSLKHHKS
jgi:hypothetical protein